jgi:hypothetical protein
LGIAITINRRKLRGGGKNYGVNSCRVHGPGECIPVALLVSRRRSGYGSSLTGLDAAANSNRG